MGELTGDYYGDYYGMNILANNKQNNRNISIDNAKLIILIEGGLSSVKIAKIFKCSYSHILRYVDKNISHYSKVLRENGRKNMIRKPSDKAS